MKTHLTSACQMLRYLLPSVLMLLTLGAVSRAQTPLPLDETCTVSIGNQNVTVTPEGTFIVPNVSVFKSADSGIISPLFRARVTCSKGGMTITGQSDFFPLVPGTTIFIGDIFPMALDPIPVSISVTTNPPVAFLGLNQTAQLKVTAKYADGTTKDVTQRNQGSVYVSVNTQFLTVSTAGVVTGKNSTTSGSLGTIVVLNQGNTATLGITAVGPSNDTDNDGMPNDWEILYGLNPNVNDAGGDLDNDGLTNLQEFKKGTIPNNPDTDDDGIPDGVDNDPLHPEEGPPTVNIITPVDLATLVEGQVILFKVDANDDGQLVGVDLNVTTGESKSFTTAPFQFTYTVPVGVPSITFTAKGTDSTNKSTTKTATVSVIPDPKTTVTGIVVDPLGAPVANASVTANDGTAGVTIADGSFSLPNVKTVFGTIIISAQAQIGGKFEKGKSGSIPPVLGGTTNVGTIQLTTGDLVLCFEQNYSSGATLQLFISGEVPAAGTVDLPGLGFSMPFVVTPGVVTTVNIPTSAMVFATDGIVNNGISVTSDNGVSVYGLNQIPATTDAFAGLTLGPFDTEFRIISWSSQNGNSEFAVTAATDNTTLTITPSVTAGAHPIGVPYNVILNKLQVYQLQTFSDLTGTHVMSDKPVAVFAGHTCANIPTFASACDHINDQMPSVVNFGTSLLTVPLASRLNGDTFRILASQDGTSVQVNGPTPDTFQLDAGQYVTLILQGNNEVTSDKPIVVAQYSNGTSYDNQLGDPFLMVITPASQFKTSYTVSTPGSGFIKNFINIVAPTEETQTGGIILDGVALLAADFTPIGLSGFSGAQKAIAVGGHTVTGNKPIGVYVYGFNQADSYGYPGGSRF